MVDVVVVRPDPQPIAVGEPGFVPLGVAAPLGLGAVAAAGVAPASSHEDHVHPITNLYDGATPAAILTGGTAGAAGASTTLSRSDHSHPIVAVPTLAGANSFTNTNSFSPSSTTGSAVVIAGLAAQTGSLSSWQDSSGNLLGEYTSAGVLRQWGPLASTQEFGARVLGDANPRWMVTADGTTSWGPGTTATDATLARTGVGVMALGGLSVDQQGRAGLIATILPGTLLNMTGAHPGTTSSLFGVVSDLTFPATTTTAASALWLRVRTAASAFTVGTAQSILVNPPTIGAGSAITTLYGIRINNQGNAANNSAYGLWIDSQSGAITNNLPIVVNSTSTFSVQSTGQLTIGGTPTTALLGLSSAVHPNTAVNTIGIDVQHTIPTTSTTTAYMIKSFPRLQAGGVLGTVASYRVDTPVPSTATVASINGIMVTNQGFANATNNTGIFIFGQSGASTTNVGISIQASTTAALWLAQSTNTTDITGGIAFGSSRDTTLYRSAVGVLNINSTQSLGTENSGAFQSMTKQIAAAANPGANVGKLYFRDGTNVNTLKLVVKAGAAGTETTILDNIST